jgi:hypothetical protein
MNNHSKEQVRRIQPLTSENSSNSLEIRKVQALTGDRSLTLVFPKQFAIELGVGKGDFLKCSIDGNRLIVEKLDIEDRED